MSRNNADTYIPVIIKAPELPPLWGRLVSLSPREAELSSQFQLPTGKEVTLSFELRGAFEDMRAGITAVLRDRDGYFSYFLVFLDPSQSELLKAAIS